MRKNKVFFIVFSCALLFLPALLSLGIRFLPANNQPPLGITQKLYGDQVVKDKLILSYNNFTAVGLSFKNPNLVNKKDVSLKIYNASGELIRGAVLSGSIIPDGGFVRFSFEPITDSKGKEYIFILSAPSSGKEEALQVYLSQGSKESASVSYYKPPSAASLIGEIYSNWTGRFFKDRAFAVFYLVLIASGIGYVAFAKKETI